jgi:transcription elongation factor GreB
VSKAFTKEGDDESEAEEEPLERPRAPGAGTGGAYITEPGFRALQSELEHLWTVERRKVTQQVADAAAQGDRSENAEYIYGKKRLREIDRRIRFLSKRLDAVTVVQPSPEQAGRVFFGAWVRLEDEEGGQTTYRIVGSDEFDMEKGWISLESPLARALLGKREGDVVTVVRPKGTADFTILRIRYEAP